MKLQTQYPEIPLITLVDLLVVGIIGNKVWILGSKVRAKLGGKSLLSQYCMVPEYAIIEVAPAEFPDGVCPLTGRSLTESVNVRKGQGLWLFGGGRSEVAFELPVVWVERVREAHTRHREEDPDLCYQLPTKPICVHPLVVAIS